VREFDEDLEVALSGGGFRAAAFGLGVLLYLVHSSLNQRVKTISSVSGGSITNGFVAQKCDFASLKNAEEFKREIAKHLAEKICGNGRFWRYGGFWPVKSLFIALFLISGVALLLWFLPMATALLAQLIFRVELRAVSLYELATFAATALVWAVAVLNREWLVWWWLSWTFFGDNRTLGALSKRSVDHVFCATDLNASRPFFFSTKGEGRVFSEIYGRGDGQNEKLADAVRASAAFPPAIPPMHFKLHNRKFTGWKDAPRTIVLSDGGVWNNLGTDWSRLRSALLAAEMNWSKRTGRNADDEAMIEAQANCLLTGVLLVANASKPDKPNLYEQVRQKVPGLAASSTVLRVISAALSSTVAGRSIDVERSVRMRMLDDPRRWELEQETPQHQGTARSGTEGTAAPLAVLVEMTRKPGETAKAYKDAKGPPHWERKADEYASQLTQPLEGLKPLLNGEDTVPTTFDNLGHERTLRLIVLGYLNTRETLAVVFANHNPPAIPRREWFEELLPGRVG
jgi:predicted acylesterase/phospholipase RssA